MKQARSANKIQKKNNIKSTDYLERLDIRPTTAFNRESRGEEEKDSHG